MPKIVVVGSSNMDLVVQTERLPRAGETVLGGSCLQVCGGKGANQAVAVAKAGGDVLFFGRIGTDAFGDECLASLGREGVDVSRVLRDAEHPTGTALIMVDPAGQNTIAVAPGANAFLSVRDVEQIRDVLAEAQVLLVQLEIPLETVHYAVHLAKQAGLTVLLNPAPARRIPREMLAKIDIITPNAAEARVLTGKDVSHIEGGSRAAQELLAEGVGSVVLTLGADGALLVDANGSRRIAGHKVPAIDSTAAGDVFAGYLATALAEGRVLDEAIPLATAAAAICVTQVGAQVSIPGRRQVEDFLRSPARQAADAVESEEALSADKIQDLRSRARRIRRHVLEMIYTAGTGSVGGSLSAADLLTVLYFHALIFNAREPRWSQRDRLVYSKTHCAPALYATLAEAGLLDSGQLPRYAKLGSQLQGIADSSRTPGVDASCGSIGQGLSIASGMAIAGRLGSASYRVYALLGDGELEEGQVWEAAMTAAHQRLDNLVVLLDFNGVPADEEHLHERAGAESVATRWEAFGWNVLQADGHDVESIASALDSAKECEGRPTIIIAHTVKGKDVSFLERKADTLGAVLSPTEYELALEELAR